MADASDSKSDEGDLVWVQVPSPALVKREETIDFTVVSLFFCVKRFEHA